MNNRSIRVLEYYKIIEMLKSEITSPIGKALADELMPALEYTEVKSRLAETSEAAALVIQYGNIPFGALHQIEDQIRLAEIGGCLTPKQLLEVGDNLRSARMVKTFIVKNEEHSTKYPILYNLAVLLTPFKEIEDRISVSIIGENQISDNASLQLRKIRRDIEGKNTAIRQKLDSIIRSSENQKYLQDAIITIRQDRYVVPVKSEYKQAIKGLVHDQSASGATFYIEPFAIVELNNQLKELFIQEQQEIERILRELSGLAGEKADELRANQEILAKLDFICGKGRLSLVMRGNEPELNNQGHIRMVRARHPLIDPKRVVANTVWIGKEFKTLLVTGPNTGGKTVALKTVGLLALMNQAGLHIPVDYGSQMSVFSGIYADIGDEQSIEQSLSTFSSHMTNIVEIMNTVDKNSLVLFDELGAGTDPTEGAALAMALLTKLYRYGTTTIATTHYSELKEFALVNEGVENACVEFDVNTLSPTYKLLIGVPGKSNAFEISRKLGLSNEIIDSAKNFVQQESIQFEEVLANIEQNRRQAETDMDEAARLRIEVEKLKAKLTDKENKFMEQRDKILKDAREEARQVVRQAREESDRSIKEIKEAMASSAKDKNKKIEEAKKNLRTALEGLQDPLYDDSISFHEVPKDLRIGDEVRIVHLNQNGNVATLPDNSGNCMVQAGIMKINVNIKNLMLVKKKEAFTHEVKVTRNYTSKSVNTRAEIDLRGMNVDEAMVELDKYLDDAVLANLQTVRIIHGKGTGALRAGLTEYFKMHRHIKTYRIGAYNEGGMGVTVLELD